MPGGLGAGVALSLVRAVPLAMAFRDSIRLVCRVEPPLIVSRVCYGATVPSFVPTTKPYALLQ